MTEKERNQKAKQWLKRYSEAKRDIARLHGELDELTAKQEGAKAIQYTDMPRAPGVDGDLSDLFAQRDNMRRKIIKAMTKASRIMDIVKAAIDEVPEPSVRAVLSARYIQLMKWDAISGKLDYSLPRIHQLHRAGLGDIYAIVYSHGNIT